MSAADDDVSRLERKLARATSRERNQSTREPNNACNHMAKQLSNKTEAT